MTGKQARIAARIDIAMQPLLRSGVDDVAILAGMSDHMADFKHLIDTAKPGKNSFQALIGRQLVSADLVICTAVYFVAYTKDHGTIEVVSIRFADSQERAIFFGQASSPP